jgi:type IV pilus assembly protein PilM
VVEEEKLGILTSDNDFVGIEIGGTAVKLVQIRKSGGTYNLLAFGSAQLPSNLSQSDSKLDIQKIAQIIKQLVKSSRINTKNVFTALPGSAVFSTVIKLPPMSQAELAKAVRYQAEQNIPLKIDDVLIDWQIIRENPMTKELAVMIVAAPKVKVDRMLELFNLADMEVVYLETSPIAVARSLSSNTEPLVMIADIGFAGTELTIEENGVVSHVRSLPVGGNALTRAIAQSLGLDAAQAEQFKKKFGLAQDKLEGQVFKSMRPILNNITDEIQRSIKFYAEQYGSNVQRIILTGGSSRLPGFADYLKNLLGVEVIYGNPWNKVAYQNETAESLRQNALDFACAAGLAMREE